MDRVVVSGDFYYSPMERIVTSYRRLVGKSYERGVGRGLTRCPHCNSRTRYPSTVRFLSRQVLGNGVRGG